MRGDVAVTGMGPVLARCDRRETFWEQLRAGESQLTIEEVGSDPPFRCAVGRVQGPDPDRVLAQVPPRFRSLYDREHVLYVSSLLAARDDAGLDLARVPAERIGLFDGTSRGNFAYWHHLSTREAAQGPTIYGKRELVCGMPGQSIGFAAALLGIRGPTYTFNGTCSAGAIAVGHALRELQDGEIDVAFATGHDAALVSPLFHLYRSTGLLSEEVDDASTAVRPYTGHSGNAFGEGAVTLVLERLDHARRRGAEVLALLSAYRYGNGGQHPTSVDVTGERPATLIREALARGGVTPGAVRFVVGHGNGVRLSDESEIEYMRRVFGPRASEVPLLSTKPIWGHTLGASGVVSAAAAALMIRHRWLVPTPNAATGGAVPHLAEGGRADPAGAGIVVSFGIGGQNAVLLLRAPPEKS